jgi:short-chain 2-methylacyl-CoA dehydrogenase
MPLYRFGSEQQRRRWLPELCAGERLAAFGLTEPGGGSDIPGGMRTTARLEAGEWVIDGSKAFITNAGTSITSLVTVLARTGEDAGSRDISTIIVPAGSSGLTVGGKYSKVGWSASDTRELAFDGCRVPADHLLGERGRGYAQFLATLDEGRVAIASLATGLAAGCVTECLRHVADRTAFGHRLGHYQAIQFKLADMATQVEAARLLTLRAARMKDAGERSDLEAGMAKLFASEAGRFCVEESFRIHGGYGYSKEYEIERLYRDAPLLLIGEGTSEIQRMVIGRKLLQRNKA